MFLPSACTVRMVWRVGRASRRAKRGGPVPVRGRREHGVLQNGGVTQGVGVGVGGGGAV